MNGEQRRDWILEQLIQSEKPLSATALAKQTGVSRQIVVGDIALLRAAGKAIEATPRGYRMIEKQQGVSMLTACRHTGLEELKQELYLIVDYGGTVENVIVENPLYGQITAQLQIASRYDADLFLKKAETQAQSLLSNLTGGVHLHTIRCDNEEIAGRISQALREKGILYQ